VIDGSVEEKEKEEEEGKEEEDWKEEGKEESEWEEYESSRSLKSIQEELELNEQS
jgi:hypothetical protein